MPENFYEENQERLDSWGSYGPIIPSFPCGHCHATFTDEKNQTSLISNLPMIRYRGAENGDVIGEVPKLVPSGSGRTGTNEDVKRLS